MEECTFSCQYCGETQKLDSREAADSAALWHLFQEHPLRWVAVAGDRYPTGPPPTPVGAPTGPVLTHDRGTVPSGHVSRGPAGRRGHDHRDSAEEIT